MRDYSVLNAPRKQKKQGQVHKDKTEKNQPQEPGPTHLTIGSLFSGIGGLELGLERGIGNGCRTVWQVEQDEYCRAVLAKHWPNAKRYEDVRNVGQETLEAVDIICGGFPCQDISVAGRQAGIVAGTRSGLWYEYSRIVRELRPAYVVVENVTALLALGMDAVLGELAESGYDAEWDCIPASSVGAPHQRDRVFILAYPQSVVGSRKSGLSGPRRALVGAVTQPSSGTEYGNPPERVQDVGGSADETDMADTQGDRRARRTGTQQHDVGDHCGWQTEPDVGRVANGIPSRIQRLKALGNAVVPQVAEVVGRLIVEREALLERIA